MLTYTRGHHPRQRGSCKGLLVTPKHDFPPFPSLTGPSRQPLDIRDPCWGPGPKAMMVWWRPCQIHPPPPKG